MCLRPQETIPAMPEKGHNLASSKSCVDNGGQYTSIMYTRAFSIPHKLHNLSKTENPIPANVNCSELLAMRL
jgi:hypothetical protein